VLVGCADERRPLLAGSLRRMADASIQSIEIAATAQTVMAVIRDLPAYPEWAQAVKAVDVLESGADGCPRRARFRLDQGVIKDEYELVYDWAPDDLSVSWHLVSSQIQKTQDGSYVLRPNGDKTTVTYTLTAEPSLPMIGLLKRKIEKVIMDTALKELKRRAESKA
jgi:ribosome-associated toxin RatA of RatAB toxin-antitoxin module